MCFALAAALCVATACGCAGKHGDADRGSASAPAGSESPTSALPGVAGRVPLYRSHVVGASTLAMGRYELATSDRAAVVAAWYKKHLPRTRGGTWSAATGGYRYRAGDDLSITIVKSGDGNTRVDVTDKNAIN